LTFIFNKRNYSAVSLEINCKTKSIRGLSFSSKNLNLEESLAGFSLLWLLALKLISRLTAE